MFSSTSDVVKEESCNPLEAAGKQLITKAQACLRKSFLEKIGILSHLNQWDFGNSEKKFWSNTAQMIRLGNALSSLLVFPLVGYTVKTFDSLQGARAFK